MTFLWNTMFHLQDWNESVSQVSKNTVVWTSGCSLGVLSDVEYGGRKILRNVSEHVVSHPSEAPPSEPQRQEARVTAGCTCPQRHHVILRFCCTASDLVTRASLLSRDAPRTGSLVMQGTGKCCPLAVNYGLLDPDT
jgi:hypothetical protein